MSILKIVAASACAFLCSCVGDRYVNQSCDTSGKLALVLEIENSSLITAYIQNNTGRTFHLVQPGDGSDAAWRTPVIHWYANGTELPLSGNRDDPLINPLTLGELFDVAPGERVQLSPWIGGPRWAGTGEISLRYTNSPSMQWLGTTGNSHHDPVAMGKVRRSDRVDLLSCPVKFGAPAK